MIMGQVRSAYYLQETIAIALLVGTLLLPRALLAQEPDYCRDVLKQTNVSSLDSINKKLTYLRLIETEAEWQDAKNASGGLQAVF
jgi:hypothetical protein